MKCGIRLKQQDEINSYTNDLHEALLRKQGTTFWKCWNSKFGEKRRLVNTVNGITDHNIIFLLKILQLTFQE